MLPVKMLYHIRVSCNYWPERFHENPVLYYSHVRVYDLCVVVGQSGSIRIQRRLNIHVARAVPVRTQCPCMGPEWFFFRTQCPCDLCVVVGQSGSIRIQCR